MEQRLILVNLLIKLGVAAAVASVLVRSVEFKSLLFRESRALKQRIYLILWIGVPMALGVWVRFIQTSFLAGDLSFETTVLLGVIGGRFTGMVGGALLALPALLHGEWATLPFNLIVGFVAGQLRAARSRRGAPTFPPQRPRRTTRSGRALADDATHSPPSLATMRRSSANAPQRAGASQRKVAMRAPMRSEHYAFALQPREPDRTAGNHDAWAPASVPPAATDATRDAHARR